MIWTMDKKLKTIRKYVGCVFMTTRHSEVHAMWWVYRNISGGDNWIFRHLQHFYAANLLIKLHCKARFMRNVPEVGLPKIQYWCIGACMA